MNSPPKESEQNSYAALLGAVPDTALSSIGQLSVLPTPLQFETYRMSQDESTLK